MNDWERIVREHGPMVFGTAWRILGHAPDTEDVVQEVFLEVHRLRQQGSVRNWPGLLRRLTACRAVDCLRRRKRTVPIDGLMLASSGVGPEATAMGRELVDRLRQAVSQLSEQEGEVFCLRYFEELSYQEIADSLGISCGGVGGALHKARAKLETMLTEAAAGE